MNSWKRFKGGLVIWGVVAVAAVALIGLVMMGMVRKSEEAADGDGTVEERVVDVTVMEVQPDTARETIGLPGYLAPFADATIAAEKGGRIVEMAVDKGDRVKAGQVLVRINDRLWKAHAAQAEVKAREAATEWQRWKALKDSGGVSPRDLDTVRKARDLSAAAREQARTQVDQCVVVSPMDGIVADRYMDCGEFAVEGGALVRIVDVARLKLVLDVPERDAGAIEVGSEVAFEIADLGRRFRGTVRFVSPTATRASNAYRTEVEVDNRQGLLRAGMIASARLVRRIVDDAIVIPLAAVVNDEGEHVVFVVEDGRAVRRRVYIDTIQDQSVRLRTGLRAGDRLVTAGQRTLQDGRAVKVVRR